MGAGIIVSDNAPEVLNYYTWLKPLEDGTLEFYEIVNNEWQLIKSVPPKCPAVIATDINFSGDIYAAGDKGITGSRTVGGYTIMFKKGILVGFEPA